MKTEISRNSHKPEKRYSGVYQQQGRMITDADWNELVEIVKRRLDDVVTDLVGTGIPRNTRDDGPDGRGIWISKDEEGIFRIHGSHLYVDGIVARIADENGNSAEDGIPIGEQADFPNAPNLPDSPFFFYADVWERTVTQLEDGDLLDAGLHGADTCTRTQTMAQIKAAPDGVDPLAEGINPQIGDAPLTVELIREASQADPCDPCADIVRVGERIGNYLFRVEVHEVKEEPVGTIHITLKWSSENGAIQFDRGESTDLEPSVAFKDANKVFEFFSKISEKHLGVHLADNFDPVRGILEQGYVTDNLNDSHRYVRRWDGYVTVVNDGSGWSVSDGAEAEGAHFDDAKEKLTIPLPRLTLTLTVAGKTFVAGDYWLAPVREREFAETDKTMVLDGQTPVGILHHYIELAKVESGDVVAPEQGSPEWRKLNFPPLTDLEAWDVQYETQCAPPHGDQIRLFDSNQATVQEALDQICHIAAEHIGYKGKCPPDEEGIRERLFDGTQVTVEKALNRLCDLAAQHIRYTAECSPDSGQTTLFEEGEQTVKAALDSLCQLAAEHIGYSTECADEGGRPALFRSEDNTVKKALNRVCDISAEHVGFDSHIDCEPLQGKRTVQEALEALCNRPPDGGCCIPVGNGGMFGDLQRAVKAIQHTTRAERDNPEQIPVDVCICLLPGDHDLTKGWELNDPHLRLHIKGCDSESTRIKLGHLGWNLNVQSFRLEDVHVDSAAGGKGLSLTGHNLDIESCVFSGTVGDDPLISLGSDGRIRLSQNAFEAWQSFYRRKTGDLDINWDYLAERKIAIFEGTQVFWGRDWTERIDTDLEEVKFDFAAIYSSRKLRVSADIAGLVAGSGESSIEAVPGSTVGATGGISTSSVEFGSGGATAADIGDFGFVYSTDAIMATAKDLEALAPSERTQALDVQLSTAFARVNYSDDEIAEMLKTWREKFHLNLEPAQIDTTQFVKAFVAAQDALVIKGSLAKWMSPGLAIVVRNGKADTDIDHNRVTGVVAFYGKPDIAARTPEEISRLQRFIGESKKSISIADSGKSLRLHNNRMGRLTAGKEMVDRIFAIPETNEPAIDGIFGTSFVSGNEMDSPDNQIVARKLNLSANILDWEDDADAGFIFGRDAVETGTLAREGVSLIHLTRPRYTGPVPGTQIIRLSEHETNAQTVMSETYVGFWGPFNFNTEGGDLRITLDVEAINFHILNTGATMTMQLFVDGVPGKTEEVHAGATPLQPRPIHFDVTIGDLRAEVHEVWFQWKTSGVDIFFVRAVHIAQTLENSSRFMRVVEIF